MSDFSIRGSLQLQNRDFLAGLAQSRAALAAFGKESKIGAVQGRVMAAQQRDITRALQDQRGTLRALTGDYLAFRRAIFTLGIRAAITGFNAMAASISAVVNTLVMLISTMHKAVVAIGTVGVSALTAFGQAAVFAKLALKDVWKAATDTSTAGQNAYDKLTDSGRKFVDQLKEQRDTFKEIRLLSQEGLFPGLTRGLKDAEPFLRRLKDTAYDTGLALGYVGELLGELAGRRVDDIGKLMDRNVRTIERFGEAGVNVLEGLIDVFRAADPFIDRATKGIRNASEAFKDWAAEARKDGSLAEFFTKAERAMKAWGTTLSLSLQVIGNVLRAAFEPGMKLQKSINATLRDWRDWTGSVKGQNWLANFFTKSIPVIKSIAHFLGGIVKLWTDLTLTGNKNAERFWNGLRDRGLPLLKSFFNTLNDRVFPVILDTLSIVGDIVKGLAPAFDILLDWASGFAKAMQGMLRGVRDLVNMAPGLAKLAVIAGTVVLWKKLADTIMLAALAMRSFMGLTPRELPGMGQALRSTWSRGGRVDQQVGGPVGFAVGRGGGGGDGGRFFGPRGNPAGGFRQAMPTWAGFNTQGFRPMFGGNFSSVGQPMTANRPTVGPLMAGGGFYSQPIGPQNIHGAARWASRFQNVWSPAGNGAFDRFQNRMRWNVQQVPRPGRFIDPSPSTLRGGDGMARYQAALARAVQSPIKELGWTGRQFAELRTIGGNATRQVGALARGAGAGAMGLARFAGPMMALSGFVGLLASKAKTTQGKFQDAFATATFGALESTGASKDRATGKLADELTPGGRLANRFVGINGLATNNADYGQLFRKSFGPDRDLNRQKIDLTDAGDRAGLKRLITDMQKVGDITDENAAKFKQMINAYGTGINKAGGSLKAFKAGFNFDVGVKGFKAMLGSMKDLPNTFTATGRSLGELQDAFRDVANAGGKNLSDIRSKTKTAMGEIRVTLGRDTEAGRKAAAMNFKLAAAAIKQSVKDGVISTKTGTREIRRLLTRALVEESGGMWTYKEASNYLAGKEIDGSSIGSGNEGGVGIDAGSGKRGAASGWIGKPGQAGRDEIPIVVGKGEAVLNRHQQRVVNTALRATGMGDLRDVVENVKTPHYMATGGFAGLPRFASGGFGGDSARNAVTSVSNIVELGRWMQGQGYHVSEHPAFGGVNFKHDPDGYHYKNAAVDVNADNFPGGEKGALDRLHARLRGLPGIVELLWQVADHFDHLHVAMGAGGGGRLGALGGAAFKAVKIKAPDVSRRAQPGIDTLTRAGNSMLERAADWMNANLGMSLESGGNGQGGGLSEAAMAQLFMGAGGPSHDAALMGRIAMRESGGIPTAKGGPNTDGTYDHGLWQINDLWAGTFANLWGDRYSPTANARMAVGVHSKQGLQAWSVYNNGLAATLGFISADRPDYDGPTPNVNPNDANANKKPGAKTGPGKNGSGSGSRRRVSVAPPNLRNIKPRKRRRFRVPKLSKNLRRLGRIMNLDKLPTGQARAERVDQLTALLGTLESTHGMTSEEALATLYDGDPAYGGVPDLSAYLAANPQFRNRMSGDVGSLEVLNATNLSDLESGTGLMQQGRPTRGIPEAIGELRAQLFAHTGSTDGQSVMPGSILHAMQDYRDYINPDGEGAGLKWRNAQKKLRRQLAALQEFWEQYKLNHTLDSRELNKLERQGMSWQERKSVNSQKIGRLENFLDKARLADNEGVLTTRTKNDVEKARQQIADLKKENDYLEDKKPPGQLAKPKNATKKQLDQWKEDEAKRKNKVRRLRADITGWERSMDYISGSTQKFKTGGGVQSNYRDALGQARDQLKEFGTSHRDLVENGIPQELLAIGAIATAIGDLRGTRVSIPSLDSGSGSARDEFDKAERDNALRSMALMGEQFKVFSGFAPLAAARMVGAFAHGGVVPETGLALVHKNETIIPDPEGPFRSRVASATKGGDTSVELILQGEVAGLMRLVDARINDVAPRVVSEALGKRSRLIASAPGR